MSSNNNNHDKKHEKGVWDSINVWLGRIKLLQNAVEAVRNIIHLVTHPTACSITITLSVPLVVAGWTVASLAIADVGFFGDDAPAPVSDFSGVWAGEYSGILIEPECPISGPITIELSQEDATVTGTVTTIGSVVGVESCNPTGDVTWEVGGTVSGDTLTAVLTAVVTRTAGVTSMTKVSDNAASGTFTASNAEGSFDVSRR